MKKKFLTVGLVIALAASFSLPSCIGSFALFNKLLAWNQNISNKFVNELVFIAFWIVPVYEVSTLADILVTNTIEFWSGSSPISKAEPRIIEGNDGKYLVEADQHGYSITSLTDGSVCRLNFYEETQTWTVVGNQTGKEYELISFVDAGRAKVPTADGQSMIVDLTDDGLYAYQSAMLASDLALK